MVDINVHNLERATIGRDLGSGRRAVRLLEEGQDDHDGCVTIFCDSDMAQAIADAINYPHGSYGDDNETA